ncbi:MAG: glycerol acyltransferase [Chloroflexia bacterium]|nr:glycerol acyltransferase [Chloroflexia bacterium]
MSAIESKEKLFLDLDKVLKDRNPGLYRMLPGFILRYLKRIIHQDELNYIMRTYKDFEGLDFVIEVLNYFEIKTTIVGGENVPKEGRFVFASNHPIGGVDGMIFMQEVGKFFGSTKSMINDLLMNITNMQSLFVGVNKHGSNSRDGLEQIDSAFASDDQILIFPAGLASRRKNGKIRDTEWKKTFLSKAVKYERDIIPVHISGRVSNFFYNFANLRKLLGIKANLEMLYLSDETFKQKKKNFTITYGKPIPYQTFDKRQTQNQWAQLIKEHVYRIKDDKNAEFITE